MTTKTFLDTNILIASIFIINSLHNKSKEVFKSYTEFYWSNFVKEEYNNRCGLKHKHLKDFFQDLKLELKTPKQELYSYTDLINYSKKYYSEKTMNDAISSVNPFWNNYMGIESQVTFHDMQVHIDNCLNDLSLILNHKRTALEKYMKLTPPRIKTYTKIDSLLESEGVSNEDRHVILDGHDFACQITETIDFITFDEVCFNGASTVEKLCFESVKGKYDFKN